MLSDHELARALKQIVELEQAARTQLTDRSVELIERDVAQQLVRQVVPVRRVLEQWITGRAVRAEQVR